MDKIIEYLGAYQSFVSDGIVVWVLPTFIPLIVVLLLLALPNLLLWLLLSMFDVRRISWYMIGLSVLLLPVVVKPALMLYTQMHEGLKNDRVLYRGDTHIERMIVVNRRPPKHFYVTLKSTVTGNVYTDIYVSKHCNDNQSVKDGEQVNVKMHTAWYSDKPKETSVVFEDLPEVFSC